jgi:peptidyl-prolyl cis-trans isomerase A (cyclophilin A)
MKLVQLATALVLAIAGFGTAQAQSNEDFLTIQLKDGPVVIQLMPDVAPKHVAQIKDLASKGEYDNVAFHRVIDGFMAQTGDVQFGDMENGFEPGRAGTGGSSLPDIPAEFSDKPFVRGTVGMARSQDPNSANSQFFIMFADGGFLNGQYTVVGQVVSGMEYVDKIKRGEGGNGEVADPDRMVKVTVGRN